MDTRSIRAPRQHRQPYRAVTGKEFAKKKVSDGHDARLSPLLAAQVEVGNDVREVSGTAGGGGTCRTPAGSASAEGLPVWEPGPVL